VARNEAKIVITAEDQATRVLRQAQASIASFAGSFAALTGIAGAGGLVALTAQTVNQIAALDDLAEKTGASVESLSRLSQVAKISGIDMGTVETAMIRLTKALAGSDDESKGAALALKRIGLSVEELRGQAPDQAIQSLADALAKFEDGSGKTAAAIAILGRSGAEALPFLKDLAEAQGITAKVTGEQAAAAERLQKTLGALKNDVSNLATAFANELVPVLNRFAAEIKAAQNAGIGFFEAIFKFGTDFSGRNPGEQIAKITGQVEKLAEAQRKFSGREDERVTANRTAKLDGLQRELNYWKDIQRQRALAEAPVGLDARDLRLRQGARLNPGDFQAQAAAKAARAVVNPRAVSDEERNRAAGRAMEAAIKATEIQEDYNRELERTRGNYLDLIEPERQAIEELRKFEEIAPALELSAEQIERIRDAFRDKIGAAEFGRPLEDIKEKAEEVNDAARDFGLIMTSAFEDAVVEGKKFSEVLQALGKDLAKMLLRKAVTEPLADAASGWFKDVFKGLFGGARAEGGPVSSGRAYLVGERGPELFVPGASGSIVPNGGGVTIQQTIMIDSRSDRASILQAMEAAKNAAKAEILDSISRGGAFA